MEVKKVKVDFNAKRLYIVVSFKLMEAFICTNRRAVGNILNMSYDSVRRRLKDTDRYFCKDYGIWQVTGGISRMVRDRKALRERGRVNFKKDIM